MYLVDTNIWLERLLEQDRADVVRRFLDAIPPEHLFLTSGAEIPGYFNIWRWILKQLTPAERGGKHASPKPEAILKWAHTPIAMLGGLWDLLRKEWEHKDDDPRPPVFIPVCKNTKIAKVKTSLLPASRR